MGASWVCSTVFWGLHHWIFIRTVWDLSSCVCDDQNWAPRPGGVRCWALGSPISSCTVLYSSPECYIFQYSIEHCGAGVKKTAFWCSCSYSPGVWRLIRGQWIRHPQWTCWLRTHTGWGSKMPGVIGRPWDISSPVCGAQNRYFKLNHVYQTITRYISISTSMWREK